MPLIPFRVDYSLSANDADRQAEIILKRVREESIKNPGKKIGITYSANQDQLSQIQGAYSQGKSISGVSGANQAAVMSSVERLLLRPEYQHLQGIFRIIPIVTMKYNSGAVVAADKHMVEKSLSDASQFMDEGGVLLGLTNQHTPQGQLAIGGGVAKSIQPQDQANLIKTWVSGNIQKLANVASLRRDAPQLSPVSDGATSREPTIKLKDHEHTYLANEKRKSVLKATVMLLDDSRQLERLHHLARENHARWALAAQSNRKSSVVSVVSGDWGDVVAKASKETGHIYAALNMAHNRVPGGGVLDGMPAQEENMFRRTDCYRDHIGHTKTEAGYEIYTDEMSTTVDSAYFARSPRVCIKGPETQDATGKMAGDGYQALKDSELFEFHELRSAAVDLRTEVHGQFRNPTETDKQSMRNKIDAQLDTAISNNQRHLVLSAFGCGAFGWDAAIVADMYHQAIEKRASHFDDIQFAIFNPGYGHDNLAAFQKAFSKPILLGTKAVVAAKHERPVSISHRPEVNPWGGDVPPRDLAQPQKRMISSTVTKREERLYTRDHAKLEKAVFSEGDRQISPQRASELMHISLVKSVQDEARFNLQIAKEIRNKPDKHVMKVVFATPGEAIAFSNQLMALGLCSNTFPGKAKTAQVEPSGGASVYLSVGDLKRINHEISQAPFKDLAQTKAFSHLVDASMHPMELDRKTKEDLRVLKRDVSKQLTEEDDEPEQLIDDEPGGLRI